MVKEAARYKVLAIESEAPDFIKTTKRIAVSTIQTSLTSNIFPSSSQYLPFESEIDFEMDYYPFYGTSGQDLHTVEDELWIEFGKVGTEQQSDRYRIVSITNSWLGDAAPTAGGDNFSIQLDRPLGSDVNFITDDPNGNANIIEDGAIVNIYKYKVQNLDKFDGRFFVKIYFDDTFKKNIVKQTIGGGLRETNSKRVYSMDRELVSKHTTDLSRFATRGRGDSRSSVATTWARYFWSRTNRNRQTIYGYYNVDEFTANALYFRKYREKKYGDGGGGDYGNSQN